jgi:hypothetical protein
MFSELFGGIFDTSLSTVISPIDFCLCLGVALVLGIILALVYTFRSRYSKSFILTISILPAIVSVVIMMVNGHIGAGVAVAGAFSLVRFRSAPGSAKEIAAVFLAMTVGLMCGMGYLAFAALFALVMCLILIIYTFLNFGSGKYMAVNKTLRITIPEDLDYTTVFDDIFEEYTSYHELERVKSVNLGSMFKLTYSVTLRKSEQEKEFVDKLRTRNGNLEIMISRIEPHSGEL